MSNANSSSVDASEDVAVKAVYKRYEGLVTVRTKAVKGKGAWYWAHLEPVLVRNPDTHTPKGVKLKCIQCDTVFSASNPSRTASEHLKRGNCPNFSLMVNPISQIPPLASPSSHGKRTQQDTTTTMSVMVNSNSYEHVRPLSGGKEDLKPLALLENSVKKLKSPKAAASCSMSISKEQADKAFGFLADWFYESCGKVSFSSLEHPKFAAFLSQVGLPVVSRREFLGARLDSKFQEARMESEARIRDAAFFQIASYGWEGKSGGGDDSNGDKCLVKFMVNLPNGTRVFDKMVYHDKGVLPSHYVEGVLWETVRGLCGNDPLRCVGIVADKYKAKALRNLEVQNHWMINLSCVLKSLFSLVKEFYRELPLLRIVTQKCLKVANLINSKPQIRNILHKFSLQGYIRVVPPIGDTISKSLLGHFIAMLEDILIRSRVLNVVVLDDSYKAICLEDLAAREVTDIVQDVSFWNDVEASRSLMKLIAGMAEEIETEKPLVGQCLPLWNELSTKLKDWCAKYNHEMGIVERITERRFKRSYHPAWSAAFVLDPLYLMRDSSGKYLPPFKYLTHDQEKDVDTLVTRMVPSEEAPIALMELMKWRSEGLDPLYAQAVQVKQQDPKTGKMKIANPQSSRLVWETCLKESACLSKVASRLLFLHATSCGIKCDWSLTRSLGLETSQKLALVAAHAKLQRRDFSSSEEEKDPVLFGAMNCDDDMLNEVLADHTSSI